jgi:hypothetical protein
MPANLKLYMVRCIIFCCLWFCSLGGRAQDVRPDRKISFSGYEWAIRSTVNKQGPGPNYFSDSCVQIDGLGRLHLLITKDPKNGRWICPEITSSLKFGYGTYTFVVEGAIDHFDKNIVLGLFNYSGNDGYDEMDIEIARWGNAAYPNLNYTIWPAKMDTAKNSATTKEFVLKSTLSTHYFRRNADTVICASFDSISTDPKYLIYSSAFARPKSSVSRVAMPVHINFWLFGGNPPEDQKAVEVIIRSFQFKP